MTGYIQANILGKVRGLKYGNLAAENILVKISALGAATGGHYNSSMVAVIIYWGLYNNAFVKDDLPMDVNLEQVSDWVDDNWHDEEAQKTMASIVETYENSKHSKLVLERLEKKLEELKKKKVPTPSSKTDQISPRGKAGKRSADLH